MKLRDITPRIHRFPDDERNHMINAIIRVDVQPFNVDGLRYFSTFGHYLWFLRDPRRLLSP